MPSHRRSWSSAVAGAVIVLAVVVAGCGVSASAPAAMNLASGDPDCATVGTNAVRIPLTPTGDPAPDVSELVMCRVPLSFSTTVINKTSVAWHVTAPAGTSVQQVGGLPLDVRTFREVARPTARPGYWLEPGTALGLTAFPDSIRLVIDAELQQQWLTYGILQAGAVKARDSMPNLVRNKTYKAAATSCLDAGSRAFIATTDGPYRSQSLIEGIGLGTKSTQCGLDLKTANDERLNQARRLGRSVPDLPPSTFTSEASRLAGFLDEALTGIGKFAQAVK